MKKKICILLTLLLICGALLTACKNGNLSTGAYNVSKRICTTAQDYIDGKITREEAASAISSAYDSLNTYSKDSSLNKEQKSTMTLVIAEALGIKICIDSTYTDMSTLKEKLNDLKKTIG